MKDDCLEEDRLPMFYRTMKFTDGLWDKVKERGDGEGKVAQSTMRHSDINLTMSSHVLTGQEVKTVEILPDLSTPSKQKAVATGTPQARLEDGIARPFNHYEMGSSETTLSRYKVFPYRRNRSGPDSHQMPIGYNYSMDAMFFATVDGKFN